MQRRRDNFCRISTVIKNQFEMYIVDVLVRVNVMGLTQGTYKEYG